MTPSESAVRDALRTGRWGVLDEIASASAPYQRKARLGLVAAEEAARQLARGGGNRAQIERYFRTEGSTVLISSFGLDSVAAVSTGPAGRTGSTGPTGPTGLTGPAVLVVDGETGRVTPGAGGEDLWAATQRLAQRHGWELPADRIERFRRREQFPGFAGLGRYEFLSLLHSPQGTAVAGNAPELADIVYPLWRPRALGLTLTYRCTAECAHCYNVSGPRRSAECLGWSQTGDQLTDWVHLGVSDIGISGGEPFLYPDLVIEMVGELKALGVPLVSPFTNAFWGDDERAARALLTRLRAVGFGASPKDQVKISAGEFHAPFVPISAVLNLAAWHHEIIGNPVVMDIAFVRSDEELRKLVVDAKRRDVHGRIQWMARPSVSDSGRAKRWYEALPQRERALSELRCPIKASASLYPAGDWVYCSGTSWPVDYRRIGGLGEGSPFTILASTQRDPRVPYWQFGTFADWLRDNPRPGLDGDTARLPVRATVCGLCRDVFGPARPPRSPRRQLPLTARREAEVDLKA